MNRSYPRITFFLLFLFLGLLTAGLFAGESVWRALLSEAVLLFFYLSAAHGLKRQEERRKKAAFRPGALLYLFPLFFLLPLVTSSFSLFLSYLYGVLGLPTPTETDFPLWFLLLSSALLPALEEECFFRGSLLSVWKEGGEGGSLLFSALLFSLLHADFLKMPYAFLAGLLLGAAALVSGGWLFPFLLHLCNNLLSILAAECHFSARFPLLLLLLSLLCLLPYLSPAYRKGAKATFLPLFSIISDREGRKNGVRSALTSPLWLFIGVAFAVSIIRLF